MENENVSNGAPAPEVQSVPAKPPTPEVKPGNRREPPKSVRPKKELTPTEIQKRKKMLIMPLFFLIFGAAMWLIFAPSGKNKEKTAQESGLNAELPVPKEDGLFSDKRDAYEKETMRQKEQEKMRSLQDFSLAQDEEGVLQQEEKTTENKKNAPRSGGSPYRGSPTSSIQSSTAAYRDINRQLEQWQEQPATEVDDQSQLELQWRIQELERKQEEAEARKKTGDDQLALMEKSYQLAAKYMPQNAPAQVTPSGEPVSPGTQGETTGAVSSVLPTGHTGKTTVQPVKQVRSDVVSLLSAPVSNDEFIREYSKPRNLGFLTAAGNDNTIDKNSIRASVYQTVTLTTGMELPIRLTEPMQAGDILIPANTVITGTCRIAGERMGVSINSIQYADNIIPVELIVYDTNGQRGIPVPGNDAVSAAKEVASTLANSAGTSIMISDNAGSQLAADMGKGLIQGASQYISKKMNVVKVTVKAGYKLLLLPKIQ